MSESRYRTRKFASVAHRKRPKVFMRKSPVVPDPEVLPSPPLTASRKNLSLPASVQSTSSSSDLHDNKEDYHLVKMSSLQNAVCIFSCYCSLLTVTEGR